MSRVTERTGALVKQLEPVVQSARRAMARLYRCSEDDLDDMCGAAREALLKMLPTLASHSGDLLQRIGRGIVDNTMYYWQRTEARHLSRQVALTDAHLDSLIAGADDWRIV